MNGAWRQAVASAIITWGLGLAGIQARGEPGIEFTYVPAWGSYDDLQGTVTNVAPTDHKVAVFIYVNGWWNKPTWAAPLTAIQTNSAWTCDITTGGADHEATRIAAFLVTNGYWPTQMIGQATLPGGVYTDALAYAYAERQAQNRTIQFSGLTWTVKAGSSPMGPGPNYFSDREEDVWVDPDGKLHMTITERGGNWYCTEVIASNSFGHGTYAFYVDSSVTNLDPNMVLGLFTWDTFAPEHGYREIDVELSQWGNPAGTNAQYVIRPSDNLDNLLRFDIDQDRPTTHCFAWSSNSVAFRSSYGLTRLPAPGDVITNWICTGCNIPPPGGENPRINLWLMSGTPPASGRGTEIVIPKFEFIPPVTEVGPLHVNATMDLQWNSQSGQVYRVEWCSNLLSAAWQQLGTSVLGNGSVCTVHDDTPGLMQRFYRLVGLEL